MQQYRRAASSYNILPPKEYLCSTVLVQDVIFSRKKHPCLRAISLVFVPIISFPIAQKFEHPL